MSALLCSKADIDILVTALRASCGPGAHLLNPDRLGRELWAENVKSLAYLYNHKTRAELEAAFPGLSSVDDYRYAPIIAKAAAVAKIARFYDYQACEHPAYDASVAYELVKLLFDRFPEGGPGYDDMPWGISSDADLDKARV